MTDKELGTDLDEAWGRAARSGSEPPREAVARRARKLLAHEASDPIQSVASDMNEMRGDLREIANRIETHDKALDDVTKRLAYQAHQGGEIKGMLDRIEKKLDWLKWHATPARLVPSGEWIENPLLVPTRQETLRVEQATEPEWPK